MANFEEEIIISRAPGRITFCGGGSDISPIPEKFGGACLNASINKYTTAKFRWRGDDKIEIYNFKTKDKLKLRLSELESIEPRNKLPFDIPLAVIRLFRSKIKRGFNLWIISDIGLHSGLGTSATIFASIVGVFNEALNINLTRPEIAETAFYLESNILNHPGGRQDQYAAVFGGFNLFEFNGGSKVSVKPLVLDHDTTHELRDNLILFFLFPRTIISSGEIIKDKIKTFSSADRFDPVLKAKSMAYDSTNILVSGNLSGFADLLHKNWEEKKKFSKLVSNKRIDNFYDEIRKEGALAGKILGAGGGGHMLVFCSPLNKMKVIRRAEELGARNVEFDLSFDGLTTWRSNWHEEEQPR